MREISAGIIIFRKTQEGPKFLLLYHGGKYWNFPKGKLEKEENSYNAAIREIKEETGLGRQDLRFDNRFKVHDRYIFTQDKQRVFKIVIYFLAETRNPIVRVSKEHHGYGWFLYRDGVKMLLHQNLKNNLKRANDLILGKSVQSRPPHSPRSRRHLQGSCFRNRLSRSGQSGRESLK